MSENISKERREALRESIAAIRTSIEDVMPPDQARKHVNTLIALEKELFEKKYGLVFERHRERVDDVFDEELPMLKEDRALAVHGGGPVNAIIEGDNLTALDALQRCLKGKVNLIYIDPNYNTGSNDFRYDDTFVDKNDTFAHSKWLSFMEPRLKLAKKLLAPDAAIFISIDDREQAPLKMLCDEVFGANCFVGCISWQKTYSPKNDAGHLPTEVEYVLVYSRYPEWNPRRLARTLEMDDRYSNEDGDTRAWTSEDAAAPGASNHRGMVYGIQHPLTGGMLYPSNGRHWRFGQEQMLAIMQQWASYHLEENCDITRCAEICGCLPDEYATSGAPQDIVLDDASKKALKINMRRYKKGKWPKLYFTDKGLGGIRCKGYLDEKEGKMPTNFWPWTLAGHTDEATKELKALFDGRLVFENPKPTRLIKRILDIGAAKDAIVLDFFAGSGTTGQAVSDRNAEDGGTRRYILCTNNEANICSEVTYPRCRKTLEAPLKPFDEDVYRQEIKLTNAEYPKLPTYVEEAKAACKAARESGRYTKVTNPHIEMSGTTPELVVVGTRPENSETHSGTLKYYRADHIPYEDSAAHDASDKLLPHVRELVELENGVDFDSDTTVALVLTENEADELFASDTSELETVYIGHDVLLTSRQTEAIARSGIMMRIVPDYYYKEIGV